MVKLLKQSSIFFALRKTQGQRVDYKGTTNANPVNDIQKQNYQAWTERDNIFSGNRKMTERMASGWTTVWRLDTGELNDSERRSQDAEATVQLSDITKESEEMQIEALKEAYEELKGKCGYEGNIISAVIHVDETTPHLHFQGFCAVDQAGNLSAKDVIATKRKCAGRKRNF